MKHAYIQGQPVVPGNKPPGSGKGRSHTVRDTDVHRLSHTDTIFPMRYHTNRLSLDGARIYFNTPWCRFELVNPITMGRPSEEDDVLHGLEWLVNEKGVSPWVEVDPPVVAEASKLGELEGVSKG